jgi:hypothetical protein
LQAAVRVTSGLPDEILRADHLRKTLPHFSKFRRYPLKAAPP